MYVSISRKQKSKNKTKRDTTATKINTFKLKTIEMTSRMMVAKRNFYITKTPTGYIRNTYNTSTNEK